MRQKQWNVCCNRLIQVKDLTLGRIFKQPLKLLPLLAKPQHLEAYKPLFTGG